MIGKSSPGSVNRSFVARHSVRQISSIGTEETLYPLTATIILREAEPAKQHWSSKRMPCIFRVLSMAIYDERKIALHNPLNRSATPRVCFRKEDTSYTTRERRHSREDSSQTLFALVAKLDVATMKSVSRVVDVDGII